MEAKKQKTILIGLNELNFEYIQEYINQGYLKNFATLISKYGYTKTTSEDDYDLLEPWIQWVSIHTGKTYKEHRVFRLGDIVDRPDLKQLWEIGEAKGLKVGCVSPFNARNNLKHPAFFVPDPWTQTAASGSKTLIGLSKAVSSAVNNNAHQKLGVKEMIALLKGLLTYVPLSRYPRYLSLASRFRKKVAKPSILDNLLADTFIGSWKETKPDFSSIFLNSGAHIQHHYMFNSRVYRGPQKNPPWYCPENEDPLLDILQEYDAILERIMALGCRLFIATGLHQNPHHENTFYWRLKDHAEFLKSTGIHAFKTVVPRMSRDFLIECEDSAQASHVEQSLDKLYIQGDEEKLFTIDNRGDSLFVELTYGKELKPGSNIRMNGDGATLDLFKYVSFLAIKNGEHDGIGYFIDTGKKYSPEKSIPVKQIFSEILSTFD